MENPVSAESRPPADLRNLPSVDAVLRTRAAAVALDRFGHQALVSAIRATLAAARDGGNGQVDVESAAALKSSWLNASVNVSAASEPLSRE